MEKSFSSQLSALFPNVDVTYSTKEFSGISAYQDRITLLLSRGVSNKSLTEPENFIRCAIQCGFAMRIVTIRRNEEFLIDEAMKQLWQARTAYSTNEKLLATASLISSEHQKQKLREHVITAYYNNDFFIKETTDGLSPKQQAFILRRADRKKIIAMVAKRIADGQHNGQAPDSDEEISLRTRLSLPATNTDRQEQSQKLEKIRLQVKKLTSKLIDQRGTNEFSTTLSEERDIALIARWSDAEASNTGQNFESLFESRYGPYDVCRLISARLAEIASNKFYSDLGYTVVDTSASQLDTDTSDWKTHDLTVDSKPIDVKNARRSFASRESYSEQFVKSWKNTNRQGVAILGALSDYRTQDDIVRQDFGTTTILGYVTARQIRQAQGWLTEKFGALMDIKLDVDRSFLPGWIYEFPHRYYKARTYETKLHLEDILEASQSVDLKFRRNADLESAKQQIPHWLVCLTDKEDLAKMFLLDHQVLDAWRLLQEAKRNLGVNRRALYLTILCSVLVNAKKNNGDFSPKIWRQLLFPIGKSRKRHPLGLHDPQAYIAGLLELLIEMWDHNRDELLSFQRFKLSGPNILRGLDQSGNWRTVLAFCGGWQEKPVRVKCGKNPLYLGQSKSCYNCGNLICPDCNHCYSECAANGTRLARLNHL